MTPPPDPRAPCIIGVARRTWHPGDVNPGGAPEPLAMWEEVAREAAADSGAHNALATIDSLDVVYSQSWQYDDPPARLAERLGIAPRRAHYSGIGGSVPQVLVAEAAEGIARGDLDIGLVVGAEALATVRRMKKEGRKPEWSYWPAEKRPFPFDVPFHPAEIAHGLFEAYLTFALFDSARRAHGGRSLAAHRDRLGRLLSPLTVRAAADPLNAWFPIARTGQEITEPTSDNRLVAYPYTKLMTAIMDVDMAAAVLVAGHEKADTLGVPRDQRVYLRGWGYAEDPPYVAQRRDLWRSAAMQVAARAALDAAGISAGEVAHFDLYSCFASSLEFALDALGLAEADFIGSPATGSAEPARALTLTGGLPYHGGPGSNYMTHSLAAMVETLREQPGSFGLVSGVGMHMMKHVFGAWCTEPGAFPPCDRGALAAEVGTVGTGTGATPAGAGATPAGAGGAGSVAPIVERAEGPVTVAAYSVLHGHDGGAESAVLVCDLPGGSRCYARMEDSETLARAEEEELVGAKIRLTTSAGGVNLAVPA